MRQYKAKNVQATAHGGAKNRHSHKVNHIDPKLKLSTPLILEVLIQISFDQAEKSLTALSVHVNIFFVVRFV